MRTLAVARFRAWTTLRSTTGIFITAIVPAILALLPAAIVRDGQSVASGNMMHVSAGVTQFAWLFHALFLCTAAIEFGNVRATTESSSATPSDLMDSAPVPTWERYVGEASGIFFAAIGLHLCSLPVLVTAAVLSPLPAGTFIVIELTAIALTIFGSAAGAWRRVTPRPNPRSMRGMRVALLFLTFVTFVVLVTTEHVRFRDAFFGYLASPSARAWSQVVASVADPVAMLMMFLVIYAGYIAFFVMSAVRRRWSV